MEYISVSANTGRASLQNGGIVWVVEEEGGEFERLFFSVMDDSISLTRHDRSHLRVEHIGFDRVVEWLRHGGLTKAVNYLVSIGHPATESPAPTPARKG